MHLAMFNVVNVLNEENDTLRDEGKVQVKRYVLGCFHVEVYAVLNVSDEPGAHVRGGPVLPSLRRRLRRGRTRRLPGGARLHASRQHPLQGGRAA